VTPVASPTTDLSGFYRWGKDLVKVLQEETKDGKTTYYVNDNIAGERVIQDNTGIQYLGKSYTLQGKDWRGETTWKFLASVQSLVRRTVGNNGTVSCHMYCGTNWNNEVNEFSSSTCVDAIGADGKESSCDRVHGSPVHCFCEDTNSFMTPLKIPANAKPSYMSAVTSQFPWPQDWKSKPNAIWSTPNATTDAPANKRVTFYKMLRNNSIARDIDFAFMSDDAVSRIELDSEVIAQNTGGWTQMSRVKFKLLPGTHLLKVAVDQASGPAALIGVLLFNNGEFIVTDASWYNVTEDR
jgi:hypothetical protein